MIIWMIKARRIIQIGEWNNEEKHVSFALGGRRLSPLEFIEFFIHKNLFHHEFT